MNISVRVLSANARAQIAALQAQVRALEGQLATANATAASPTGITGSRNRKSMLAWGNQIQWTGRQLQYNWTLPLLLAGGAATKFALDNEKAFTRVQKVYGDTEASIEYFNKHQAKIPEGMNATTAAAQAQENELNSLSKAFEALSTRYGVMQKEVLETAGAWAAAGSSGLALAKSTELSIKAAILGDMDLAKATEALIAIQAQYSLSTKQLGLTLAELNAIENQTGISMQGLIEGFSRSAGVAREAGVDVRHLGAMLAALVPATGSAATAGNALKTIISRLMSPTGDAAKVMAEFGVNTRDAAWQSSTAVERLTILAGHMGDSLEKSADGGYKLSDSQQQVVASVLGSRYQMNRFLVLMREMGPANSYYEKALEATTDRQKVFALATKELNAVLESSPQRLQIIWATLQNGMADAIQPMIPYILYLAQAVATAVQKFGELDPEVQKLFLVMGTGLLVLPMMIRYFGSLVALIDAIALPIKAASAAWVSFMTVSKMVDGVLITTRLSLLSVAGTILTFPFKFFLAGMASIFSALKAAPAVIAVMATVAKGVFLVWKSTWVAVQALWVAAWAKLRLVSLLGSLAQVGVFTKMRAVLVTISTATWGSIKLIWTAGWATLQLITGRGMAAIARMFAAVGAFMIGPWGIAIAAVIGLIYVFRDDIVAIWGNIVAYFADSTNAMTQLVLRAWNALPQGVANALTAVATMVRDAALQIYEWFSYINPFARHSPSLVENVIAGMAIVGQQFGMAAGAIKGHVMGAYRDISAFGKAVRGVLNGAASFEQAQQRAKIKKFAPGALDEFDALSRRLKVLESDLAKAERSMTRQQNVVNAWSDKVERANRALDVQQKKLEKLTAVQDAWQAKLDEAQDRLSGFASAPIEGMGAMSDKIFENEMAQKRLRLEMMKIEDAGGSFDDIREKIEAINGAQEMLRGEQANMRAAGAGSEILSQYDDQIAALEATKNQQNEAAESISNLTKQLEELERQGQVLDLENSLKFDPLTRQIEQAANAMDELPFDKIMAGVQGAAADIERYQGKLADATAAVDAQKAVVDRLTAARDTLQASLDREQEKLDKIKGAYDAVKDAISEVSSTMSDAASAADTLARKAEEAARKAKGAAGGAGSISPAVQNFRDAAGGNFANVGGAGIPVRTDWSDQSAKIDQFTQELADQSAAAFSDLNPFTPLKNKFNQFVGWAKGAWGSFTAAAGDMFDNVLPGGSSGGMNFITDMVDRFKVAWESVSSWFKSNVIDPLAAVWRLFWPSIKEFLVNAWKGIKDMFGPIGKELGGLFEEITKMGPAFKGLWNILKVVLGAVGGAAALITKIVINVLAKVIRPALALIGDVIAAIIRVIKGAVQIVSGFFMLFNPGSFTDGLKKMAAGVGNIFGGMIDAIWSLIKNGAKIIFGAFWGIVDGIIDAALWLWDEMVGHSIIPDLINGIIFWFNKLKALVTWVWDNVVTPIFSVFRGLFNGVITLLGLWWTGITTAWAVLKTVATWLWDNVLKPIFDSVKDLWEDWVKPAFALWWAGIKAVWSGLKTAATWLWNNVFKPVFNKAKELWDNWIKPAFGLWWSNIKAVWNTLKALGGWVWDNVLKPVFNRAKDLWSDTRGELSKWWDRIKGTWDNLKGLGGWVKQHVMDPVFDKITGTWTRVKNWLKENKDILTAPVNAIVNTVVRAVNTIIKGLNKVADILPGADWNINLIPELAQGGEMGRRANRGFKTTGARAIVGEGKPNYPEFVIPTDPTYRHRALGLLSQAASRIGVTPGVSSRNAMGDTVEDLARVSKEHMRQAQGAIPEFAIGGWLSDRYNDAKGGLNKLGRDLKDLPKRAVGKVMDPALDYSRNKIKKVGWQPAESPPLYAINKLESWVKDADSSLDKLSDKARDAASGGPKVRAALAWARTQQGKPYKWGSAGPDGYDCSGFMAAITNHLRGAPLHSRLGSTATMPWPGFAGGVGPAKGFIIGTTPNYAGSGIGHMAGTLGGVNVESAGGIGVRVGPSARGYMDSGFSARYHLPLKEGGIALARRGPTLAAIGDGRYDEAVVPLPKGWRNGVIGDSDSGKTFNFYGDLSFPNVKDGSDAQAFLENLENVARD